MLPGHSLRLPDPDGDPAALLELAWSLEPALRLPERKAALDRLEELLADGEHPAPPGRSWELELLAERAIDAVADVRLEEGAGLADQVLREAHPSNRLALARATFARGRALAWTGTDVASREADAILSEAAERFRQLNHQEWQGFAVFWRAYAVHFQTGNLVRAAELMREALEIMGPDSPRRATVLTFYADALVDQGEFELGQEALSSATTTAVRHGDRKSHAYVAWSAARLASARGDALGTERMLREAERDAGDWFDTHIGVAFLSEAAQLLDRVGLTAEAAAYLARACESDRADDEAIMQARATVLARSGDPWQGLEEMQALMRGDWLEKRLIWRDTLLTAWATFRAGRGEAGEIAARALGQAIACGSVQVAVAGEAEIVAALAPLAEAAGSQPARELLIGNRQLIIRLFGTPSVRTLDGSSVGLPVGKPGELVRLLALHEHGLPTDVVLELFFPDAPASVARQRLRQVLTRLRAASGEIVVRDGEHLRLVPAWVDAREFLVVSGRSRGLRGTRSIRLCYAALALCSGPLLPTDPYASWAQEFRDQVEYRQVELLDLIAEDAAGRGSHQEALTALDAAVETHPRDEWRHAAIAEQLRALRRTRAAALVDRRGGRDPATLPAIAAATRIR